MIVSVLRAITIPPAFTGFTASCINDRPVNKLDSYLSTMSLLRFLSTNRKAKVDRIPGRVSVAQPGVAEAITPNYSKRPVLTPILN